MVKVEIDLTQEIGELMEAETQSFMAEVAAHLGLDDDDVAFMTANVSDFTSGGVLDFGHGLDLVFEVDVDALANWSGVGAAALKEAFDKVD